MSLGSMNLIVMIILAMAWIVIAAALGLDLSGRRRAWPGFRWLVGGLLILLSTELFSEFTHDRNWPGSQLLAIDVFSIVACVALLVCIAKAISVRARSRRLTAHDILKS